MSRGSTIQPGATQTRPRQRTAAAVRGWLAAAVYVGLALWLLRDDAWQYGEVLWPSGPMGLPMAIGRGLTWLLLGAMLGFGLAWPAAEVRRWVWVVTLGVIVIVPILSSWWWLAPLGITLHMMSFNPAWLPPALPEGTDMDAAKPEPLFYDGMCGLCHRWVKVVLRADPEGNLFYFSPLQGEHIKTVLTPEQVEELPDSVVVVTHDRRVLVRSDAVIHILRRLGGWHKLGYFALSIIPRPLRDFGYKCVAGVRHKLFATPDNACPMTPPEQRSRFVF